jgi:predicted DCC family thiol-disulfide oxidoreductase YuxK
MAVIFFDGHCNLCNRFVDFLISRDRKHRLKFAPLQGLTAATRLAPEYREKLGTVVLEKDGRAYVRSTAAILAVAELGGRYRLAKVFLIIPKLLRDLVYRYIAKNRYLWFGRRDTCRVPTEQERAQFLD